MIRNLEKIIEGRISTLPEKMQEILFANSWKEMVKNITTRYTLNEEEANNLKTEIFLILTGLEPINNFRTNLVKELDISYDQALKIASDTNTGIFNPIMEILKKAEGEIKKVDEEDQAYLNSPEAKSTAREFMPNLVKSEREVILEPNHMIPDHAAMEKTEGVHVHSQTVMPSNVSAAYVEPKKDASVGSIVDQKLRQVVRSTEEKPINRPPSNLPTRDTDPYKGNDPYREPIN